MAQFGSASALGAEGPRFKSGYPDHAVPPTRTRAGGTRRTCRAAVATSVTESTVKTHVGRIFTKLAVRERVQAAVTAYDAGLVVPGGD
jgi:hypothetical protein